MCLGDRRTLIGLVCLAVVGGILNWTRSGTLAQEAKEEARKDPNNEYAEKREEGRAIADRHMTQWKRKNPKKAENWIEEEKERHALVPPADNTDLLKGEQGESHAYGNYTEKDILMWRRETEKLVVEGSRIFHSADLLGGTVGASCDMCHPHAANTHPETYPKFQAQMGRVALLRDMINWCIEHPVRGEPMEPDDPRMRALEAYITAQRKGHKLNYGRH